MRPSPPTACSCTLTSASPTALALLPYFVDLGVDWLYLAPVFTARPGSRHGYDVVDSATVNPELGGRAGLEALADAVHEAGLRILLDIVPNHEAATTRNPHWYALLRDGPDAARWFDVDTAGNEQVDPGRVLWPLLGASVADELAAGALHADVAEHQERVARYYEETLPLVGSPDADLADALERQHYKLASWRTGTPFLNYRRFFDVSELAGVRVEDPDVFAASHALIAELWDAGIVDGLRVDHVDGLADPATYLRRLGDLVPDAFVVTEKILAADEVLPPDWPIAGTTGYESTTDLTAVLIDSDGRARLEGALLAERDQPRYDAVERATKDLVLRVLFPPEWRRTCRALHAAAAAARVDLDPDLLTRALAEITLGMRVYRTYCTAGPAGPSDRARIADAVTAARAHASQPALAAVSALLLGDAVPSEATAARLELVRLWQQLTGPVMAKGREDTACYRYPVLLAQAEVGNDPSDPAIDAVARFHTNAARRVESGRPGLTATTTHDTKRSEDLRARLAVLSERSEVFEAGLARWTATLAPPPTISARELRFVAQTLVATWPLDPREHDDLELRLSSYFVKALREAKEASSWLAPDEAHEARVIALATQTIAEGGRVLHEAFGDLVDDVAWYGAINGLAQLTWKLGAPGTADIYRGCELWDFSLVDPDNRRPVDYGLRIALLRDRSDDWRSGAVKLQMTAAGLHARRAHPELFIGGAYVPIAVPDDAALAFAARESRRGPSPAHRA